MHILGFVNLTFNTDCVKNNVNRIRKHVSGMINNVVQMNIIMTVFTALLYELVSRKRNKYVSKPKVIIALVNMCVRNRNEQIKYVDPYVFLLANLYIVS